jgi:hypothetical protein
MAYKIGFYLSNFRATVVIALILSYKYRLIKIGKACPYTWKAVY